MITSAGLKAADFGGLINEDVMQQIFDISPIPLPLTDMISTSSVGNAYASWPIDKLQAVNIANAVVDGSDTDTLDDGEIGTRVGNQAQISVKVVKTSTRANASDTIGIDQTLANQVMRRQKELRRDVEAIMLTNQASVEDNGTSTAGKSAGLGAWLTSNISRGVGGADGGFANGIVAAPTPGAIRALDETTIRDIAQAIYVAGGNPSVGMSIPDCIRRISEYMLTPSARVAILQSDTGQTLEAMRAKGAVNVFMMDFGVSIDLVANRLQQKTVAGTGCDLFLIDPQYLEQGILDGYRTEPLAKTGLSEQRQMAVDWMLKCLNEEAHGVIADIDYTLPMIAEPVPPI